MIKYLENEEELEQEIKEGKVLLDFYADWCGPCKMLSTVLEDLTEVNKNIKIIKINIDKLDNIAKQYGIMSIPTLILYNEGKQINKKVGFISPEELENFVK